MHMEGGPEIYSSSYPIYLSELKDSAINPRPELTPAGFQSVDAKTATFTVTLPLAKLYLTQVHSVIVLNRIILHHPLRFKIGSLFASAPLRVTCLCDN